MIGWFDGGAGASGDMLLGALVGAGVPVAVPAAAIESLRLGVSLETETVARGSLAGTRVHVIVPEARQHRHLDDILALFGPLDDDVAAVAARVFTRLAHAEAAVHGTPLHQVHFHEVGALDSIADIVGVAACLCALDLDHVLCSTLSLGSGQARGAHGPLPVPVPAVLELLKGDVPVQAGAASFESTTPTGAAVLATVVDRWGPMPPMMIESVGIGAGGRDTDEVANALRLVLGRAAPSG